MILDKRTAAELGQALIEASEKASDSAKDQVVLKVKGHTIISIEAQDDGCDEGFPTIARVTLSS